MNFKRQLLLFFLFIFVFSIFSPVIARADDNGYQNESVTPKDGYKYTFKRLREKAKLLMLSFSPDRKLDYYQELLNFRLSELASIARNKDIANIQTGSQRYSTTAGEIAQFVKHNPGLDKRKEQTKEIFSKHSKIIEDLEKNYNDTTAEWRFLKHDFDYLNLYDQQLSN